MFKAVIFDIDGTLTQDIAWVKITEEVGGSIEYNDHIVESFRRGEIQKTEAISRMIENWTKAEKGRKQDWERILRSIPLREDAKETIEYLKNKGYYLCMITGAFDIYAQIIAEEIGIEKWFANTSTKWGHDGKLIDIDFVLDDKTQKVKFFKEFCESKNLNIKECVPIGDSENDLGLFELTGNGIAVKTKFEALELEKVSWEKINHLIELKNIL